MTSKPQASYVHPDDRDPRHQRLHFSPYLSPESIEQGIRSGNLIRGILRISKRDRSDAYVVPDTLDSDIFIHGQRDRNRALDGDVVAVRMLDVDVVWKKKKEAKRKRTEENAKIRANAEAQADTNAEECHGDNGNMVSEVDEETEEESELDECDAAEELNEDKSKPKYAGEIVGILDRDANQTTLSIEMPGKKDSEKLSPRKGDKKKEIRLVWFRPTDKRMPLMAITLGSIPQDFLSHQDIYSNMLFTAQIVRWSIDSRHPLGRIVTAIGSIGTIAAETLAILSDNNVKGSGFSDVVINSLPKTPWSIPAKEYDIRRDLREVRIFTIDPATAKDLDDAVHVKRLEDGIFEVGVHIADVSYFVKKNTPLDTEARERGTSTYLVDRVIPMLPSLLCEELCSLNPSVERLAFSVIWKMDEFANILDTWFGRTIIKSCAKLAYDDAQSVIDGNGLPSSVTVTDQSRQDIRDDIMHLYNLSRQMRKRRFENGALSINSIRLCFELDDSGEPKDVWVYELKAANRLIEEFMLCANMSVAEKIINHFPDEALLRRHAPPLEKRLDEFLQLSEKLGYHLDGSSSGSLQESFNAIESEQAKAVLTILAIKPMQRAKYFCTGAIDIARYSHYALNVPLYTHFTSPIRRYADIIVHRLLDASLQGKKASGYDTKKVQKIALDCNRKSDGARNAQDQSIQLYLAHYLQRLEQTSGPIIRSAVVVQVTKEAFDVIVPEYGIEKRIPLDTLPITKAKLDSSDFSLSIYWQKGVPVPSREDGSPTYIMEPVESTSDDDIESCPSLPVAKPSQIAALPSETYDPDTGMQQLKVFTKFDVLIKAAIARSPPIINVYPINPYV
ncbi:hypothetical protein BX666DRAFT_1848894 [Dichotomocladium elegans]|nr:hypothetical protein BX666DRAFT_1848894 [Dichotomocladium elegans]